METLFAAAAALKEATRPRSSGRTVNVHEVRTVNIQKINYDRMKDQIERPSQSVQKEIVKDDKN